MISRPRKLSESTLIRAGLMTTGVCAAIATPASLILANATGLGQRFYIAAVSSLLVVVTLALLVGLAREAARGVRHLQMLMRVRRRRVETVEMGSMQPMPA